jgi:hypothetical protein
LYKQIAALLGRPVMLDLLLGLEDAEVSHMAVLCLNEKSGRIQDRRSKSRKKVVSHHNTEKNAAKSRKTDEYAGKLLASRSNLPASILLRENPDFSDKRMVSEVSSYIKRYVFEGWEASIISFMFKPLPNKRASMLRIMNSEVELFYSKLVTRVDRDPTAPSHFQRLPRLFVAPDPPVYKHIKDPRPNVTINDGFHGQGICLIPPNSRLKDELCLHVKAKEEFYLRDSRLRSIHLTPIKSDPEYVTKYVMKMVGRQFAWENVIWLPKVISEAKNTPPSTP